MFFFHFGVYEKKLILFFLEFPGLTFYIFHVEEVFICAYFFREEICRVFGD